MLRLTSIICILSAALIFFHPISGLARVGTRQEGAWPETWPEELQAYRNQARTLQVAHGTQETVYEIRFKDRREFERIWPTIVELKSKGAPLTLLSPGSMPEGQLFDYGKPMIHIYCPPYGSSKIRSLGKLSGVEPPWPESVRSPKGRLPEYVEPTENGGWTQEQKEKRTRVKYRARIDIHLVVDGEIIDLNRIRLPAETSIIDKRNIP